jgi:hypothetical protein
VFLALEVDLACIQKQDLGLVQEGHPLEWAEDMLLLGEAHIVLHVRHFHPEQGEDEEEGTKQRNEEDQQDNTTEEEDETSEPTEEDEHAQSGENKNARQEDNYK